jgi:uncharacterized protein
MIERGKFVQVIAMDKWVFRGEEIPPEGLKLELDPDPSIYMVEEVDVKMPPGLSGWISLNRQKDEIVVQGDISAVLQLSCSRCLNAAENPVSGDFYLRLVPGSSATEAEEIELKESELEVEFFTGGEIDLRRIISEQVYLNVPIKPLCREDCRGLCPLCGQDLNKEDCGHRPERTDPRWEVLKELKNKE